MNNMDNNNMNVDNTVANASITISVKQLIVVLGVVLSTLGGTYLKITGEIESSKTDIKNDILRLDDQNREDTKQLDSKIQKLVEFHMNNPVPSTPAPVVSTQAPPQ